MNNELANKLDDSTSITSDHQVHYWALGPYSEGFLIGKWFDLEGLDAVEHQHDLKEWVEELSEKCLDAGHFDLIEEWIVGDTEGVPSSYVNEHSISREFFDYMSALDASHHDADVFEAGAACGIPVDEIDDKYEGQHDSDTDLAYSVVEDSGLLDEVSDTISSYFDYEAFGRDLAINDFTSHNDHYFRTS